MTTLYGIKASADHAFFRLIAADTAEAAVAKYIAEDGEPGEAIYAIAMPADATADVGVDLDSLPMFGGTQA